MTSRGAIVDGDKIADKKGSTAYKWKTTPFVSPKGGRRRLIV